MGEWYPGKNIQKLAKIDEYLDFHHNNTRKCHFYVFNVMFAKKIRGRTDAQFVEPEARNHVETALATIERYYLKNGDNAFLLGDHPTLADLSAYF